MADRGNAETDTFVCPLKCDKYGKLDKHGAHCRFKPDPCTDNSFLFCIASHNCLVNTTIRAYADEIRKLKGGLSEQTFLDRHKIDVHG